MRTRAGVSGHPTNRPPAWDQHDRSPDCLGADFSTRKEARNPKGHTPPLRRSWTVRWARGDALKSVTRRYDKVVLC